MHKKPKPAQQGKTNKSDNANLSTAQQSCEDCALTLSSPTADLPQELMSIIAKNISIRDIHVKRRELGNSGTYTFEIRDKDDGKEFVNMMCLKHFRSETIKINLHVWIADPLDAPQQPKVIPGYILAAVQEVHFHHVQLWHIKPFTPHMVAGVNVLSGVNDGEWAKNLNRASAVLLPGIQVNGLRHFQLDHIRYQSHSGKKICFVQATSELKDEMSDVAGSWVEQMTKQQGGSVSQLLSSFVLDELEPFDGILATVAWILEPSVDQILDIVEELDKTDYKWEDDVFVCEPKPFED